MPMMNQDIQENIVTDTTALFARYGFDLTPLGDMYSPFWGSRSGCKPSGP